MKKVSRPFNQARRGEETPGDLLWGSCVRFFYSFPQLLFCTYFNCVLQHKIYFGFQIADFGLFHGLA